MESQHRAGKPAFQNHNKIIVIFIRIVIYIVLTGHAKRLLDTQYGSRGVTAAKIKANYMVANAKNAFAGTNSRFFIMGCRVFLLGEAL